MLKSSPEGEFNLLVTEANLAFSQGKFHDGHTALAQISNVAGKLNLKETAADTFASAALFEAFIGKPKDAARDAENAISMSRAPIATLRAAAARALAGFSANAQALSPPVEQQRRDDELVQSIFGPSVQAATLVSRGNPTGAIDVLQKASPYDNNTVVLFLRATAYLKAHRASEASTRSLTGACTAWSRTRSRPYR